MTKYSPAYLKKLEEFLRNCGYELRYEKGNFKSNYCVLEAKKVVVINKFSAPESRMQSLLEIIRGLAAAGAITADLKIIGLQNPLQTGALDFPDAGDAPDAEIGVTEDSASGQEAVSRDEISTLE